MAGFVQEVGNTMGVEKSSISYQANFYKLGNSSAWTSSQLPINLTKGKYKIELELVNSSSRILHSFHLFISRPWVSQIPHIYPQSVSLNCKTTPPYTQIIHTIYQIHCSFKTTVSSTSPHLSYGFSFIC
jgi:hypothetical protein